MSYRPRSMVDLGGGRGWLTAEAAASIFRIDRQIGHLLQITEAGRSFFQQEQHWLRYLRNGSPIALNPNTPSVHQIGDAIDSDEAQRFIDLMADHGWYRTVYRWVRGVWTLVERWHFEYFPARDNRRHDPAPAAPPTTPAPLLEDDDMLMLKLKGIGTGEHFVALGPGIFGHFVDPEPYELIMQLSRIQDDWQVLPAAALPAMLNKYGCDPHIWDWRNGQFCVLDPLSGTVKPGNTWTASGATRAAIAGIKMPEIDPSPIIAVIQKAFAAEVDLTAAEFARAVVDEQARRLAA